MSQTNSRAIASTDPDRQIFTKQDPLTASDRQIIAAVLTWDAAREISPHEVITIAITHDILWVRLTEGRSVPLAVETFKNIRRQQLEQQADADVARVMEVESKLQAVAEQEPMVEVDRADSGYYRVWRGFQLIGTFYQYRDTWIAHPVEGKPRRCKTATAAQKAIALAVHMHSHSLNKTRGAA